jgi:hypothetical protein
MDPVWPLSDFLALVGLRQAFGLLLAFWPLSALLASRSLSIFLAFVGLLAFISLSGMFGLTQQLIRLN